MEPLYSVKKRRLAGLFCILFVAFLLLTSLFLVKTASHKDCDDAACEICATIKLCETVLQNLGTTPGGALLPVAISFLVVLTLLGTEKRVRIATVPLQNIRMNN